MEIIPIRRETFVFMGDHYFAGNQLMKVRFPSWQSRAKEKSKSRTNNSERSAAFRIALNTAKKALTGCSYSLGCLR
jgi:hypothetical protein